MCKVPKMKFYICQTCGNIIVVVKDSGVGVVCCGHEMTEIEANTTDGASKEKHVPIYEVKDGKVNVTVGTEDHPMTSGHYIEWISVVTNEACHRKKLCPSDPPKASFALLEGEKVRCVMAYCNIHGLWRAA